MYSQNLSFLENNTSYLSLIFLSIQKNISLCFLPTFKWYLVSKSSPISGPLADPASRLANPAKMKLILPKSVFNLLYQTLGGSHVYRARWTAQVHSYKTLTKPNAYVFYHKEQVTAKVQKQLLLHCPPIPLMCADLALTFMHQPKQLWNLLPEGILPKWLALSFLGLFVILTKFHAFLSLHGKHFQIVVPALNLQAVIKCQWKH